MSDKLTVTAVWFDPNSYKSIESVDGVVKLVEMFPEGLGVLTSCGRLLLAVPMSREEFKAWGVVEQLKQNK